MSFEIGLSGPILLASLHDRLGPASRRDALPPGLGGTPVNILATGLLDRGWTVRIYTLDPAVRRPMVLEGPGLRIHIGPYRARHRARDAFAAERRALTEAMLADPVPLINAHWAGEFAWAAQTAAAATGAAVAVSVHDAPFKVLKFDRSPYRLVRTAMALKVLRQARHVVPSSDYVARHLRRFHLCRPPIAMIPNGLPAQAFQTAPVTGRLKQEDGAPVIASILNGWGGLKNGATSLKAFALLRRHCPQARLLMYGGGHGPGEEAESWAAAHGLCRNVEFLGFRPHEEVLQRLRDEVDILLHPSREEAQGLVLAEAMANGAVVVAGLEAGGVAATLDHGRAGILTDIEDPAAISLCLQRLVDDARHRSALAKAGYEHARRHFHSDAMVSAYETLYRQLAEGMRYDDR